jgi:lincosamide nucleotidyltransferase A/C/D/E
MAEAMLSDTWYTPRLRARRPRLDDAEAIFQGWATDPDVTRFLTWRPHQRSKETRDFLVRCLDAWDTRSRRVWALTRSDEDKVIGIIELRVESKRAELGYVLSRPAWGQGYMTEAAQTLAHLALHEIPLARLSAVCDVENMASARVLEKSGLLREGRLRRYIMHPNMSDEPRDVYLYARTRPLQVSMSENDVLALLAAVPARSIPVWVVGGWGIDALLGEQTRLHDDLDLAHRVEDEPELRQALEQLGYRIVLDYRPARIAFADDGGREVDLHPVRFDALGDGVQAGFQGQVFHYPANCFTTGSIGNVAVACLTAEQQQWFHRGYELRERDRQDLARLNAAFEQP